MKLLRHIAILLAFTLGAMTARADILLWQVTSNPVSGTDFGGSSQQINWDYAILRVAPVISSGTAMEASNAAIYQGTGAPQESPAFPGESATSDGYILGNYIDYDKPSIDNNYNMMVDQSAFEHATVGADLSAIMDWDENSSDYMFFVELYDSANMLVGYSAALRASDFENFTNASLFFSEWTSSNVWTPDSWTAVPEPSSGLLMLIGLAIAGLRRKNAKA